MPTDDDIRAGLFAAAASIDPGDATAAEGAIRANVRRRRTRTRLVAGLAVVALFAGGAAVVTQLNDADEPDMLVGADATVVDEPDSTPPVSALEDSSAAAVTTETATVIDRPGVVAATQGSGNAPQYAEWSVAWKDGFLVGSTVFAPQPLPTRLPEEVRALFPQEVLDLFPDGLPATLDEATAILSDAGLLDEVTAIISANPAASDAIYSAPPPAPDVDVRFTRDGETWEPVEFDLPPGATYLMSVTGTPDRIVAAYTTVDPMNGQPIDSVVRIASTTDLVNWDVDEITVTPPPVVLPEGVTWNVMATGLAANDSGWVATVVGNVSADFSSMLPADLRARFDAPDPSTSIGISQDDTGVTVEFDGMDDDRPSETFRLTWEELGVAADVVPYLSGNEGGGDVWASTWNGAPSRSADRAMSNGAIVATPRGFLEWTDQTWFSPDGLVWSSTPLPVGDGYVTGAFAFDGGVIAVVSTPDGTQYVRLDETGGSPQPLEISGAPASLQAGYSSNSPRSLGFIGVAGGDVAPLVIEHEGYRLTLSPMGGVITVTDLASGDVVVTESFGFGVPDGDAGVVMDADGITVEDPATGEVVVVFPSELLETADAANESSREVYAPDMWLIASADGEQFVVDDLDESGGDGPGPVMLVGNGTRLLVQTNEEWTLYDLP